MRRLLSTIPLLLLLLANSPARSDELSTVFTVIGETPFSEQELAQAAAGRLVPGHSCTSGPLAVLADRPDRVELRCGGRSLRVQLGELRGPSAARVVVLAAAEFAVVVPPAPAAAAAAAANDEQTPRHAVASRPPKQEPRAQTLTNTAPRHRVPSVTAPHTTESKWSLGAYAYARSPLQTAHIGAPGNEQDTTGPTPASLTLGVTAQLAVPIGERWRAIGTAGYGESVDALQRMRFTPIGLAIGWNKGWYEPAIGLRATPYLPAPWEGPHTDPDVLLAATAAVAFELPPITEVLHPTLQLGVDVTFSGQSATTGAPSELQQHGPRLVWWAGAGATWW